MKKTFRKALACLLAVLMVAFSLPFTAFARDAKEWWVEDGVALSDITAEPDYIGFADDDEGAQYLEDFMVTQDEGYVDINEGAPDLRENYKPVLAVTVTSLGEDGIAGGTSGAQAYYNKYYGYNKTLTFDKVNATGTILNPGQLKAGQRIAVTYEMGGFDILASCMVMANWNPEFLEMGYYAKNPTANAGDTWEQASKVTRTGGNLYTTMVAGNSGVSDANHEFYMSLSTTRIGDCPTSSTYIGKAADIGTGKYGIIVGTVTFRVLKDCDLKDVLTYNRNPRTGTIALPYDTSVTDELEGGTYTNVLINAAPGSAEAYSVFAEVWENYSNGDEPDVPHTHDYQLTSTTDATCTTDKVEHYTCSNADGKCDALTSDKTIENTKLGHDFTGKVTANAESGKHNVQCTRCDATDVVACSYTSETIGADCTKPGTIVWTCACGDSYTESTGSALGHDFVKGTVISDKVTKEATCEADGERTIVTKCVRCDETETTTATITKTGHAWDDGVVTTVATCQTEGVKTYTCANDKDHTKTESIGKDKNNHVGPTTIVGAEAATCAKDGYTGDEVCACGEIVKAGTVISKDTVAHTPMAAAMENEVAADYDNEGSYDMVVRCEVCNAVISSEHFTTPVLEGIKVTVTPSALGTATVKGLAVEDEAVTANCAPNADVVLTATPVEGAVFVGWNVDGKLVSTAANVTVKALADITYVPVFQNAAEKFTVVFADRYGNIFATQEVTSGAEINLDAVKAPAIAGYTFVGWSVEDVTTITGATTIQAVYEKNETAGYTVTATGCSITAGAEAVADVLEGVEYDTLVTVTAEGAKAWTINGATVAYGESYTFYVGSDVTVVPVFDDVTTVKPQVAAVDVSKVVVDGKTKASFLATRTMTADCTYVNAGFVYGKNLANNDITLADVKAGSAVKAYYCATNAEQFALTVGSADGTGVLTARAFLAYVDANGATQVVYAEPQTFDYATMA
ncbi:MAG: hypothetical protein K2L19_09620 [Eubacterium sp.]|nr:hypothetical protein [Eubacterium sp.]